MFEPGKMYWITERHDGTERIAIEEVLAWTAPLLQLRSRQGDIRIINTHSPSFYSAQIAADIDRTLARIDFNGIVCSPISLGMSDMHPVKNYNHQHVAKALISQTTGQITVGDIRNAIAHLQDDAEVHLGVCDCGCLLTLSGFKDRGGAISFNVSCSG